MKCVESITSLIAQSISFFIFCIGFLNQPFVYFPYPNECIFILLNGKITKTLSYKQKK
jgi:hypothetical protein